MTLTNNISGIQTLAYEIQQHVDRKEYDRAHLVLDDIEKKVQEVRRHVDHLQNVRDFCARPAGEDTG